jgi:aspartate ammonia-lyase
VLFNALFAIHTQRAIDNCRINAYWAHSQIIRATGMIKKAAVVVNYELGLINEKCANVIRRAAEEVIEGKWNAVFLVDVYQAGASVSFHMNANEVNANRAIELLGRRRGDYALCHPNDHLNCCSPPMTFSRPRCGWQLYSD